MKKFEVSAYSLEEAKATVLSEYGLKVMQNVSQSWKNAGSPVSGKEFEEFCIDMLDKKRLTGVEGVGLVMQLPQDQRILASVLTSIRM